MKRSDIDWDAIAQRTRENLLLMRELERAMHAKGIPLPPKRLLVAMAEQELIGDVQILPPPTSTR